jgi:hypothetical protein
MMNRIKPNKPDMKNGKPEENDKAEIAFILIEFSYPGTFNFYLKPVC